MAKNIELSDKEYEMIIKLRKEEALQQLRTTKTIEILKEFGKYVLYLQTIGEFHSFSTLVNRYGYDDKMDSKILHNVVEENMERVLNSVRDNVNYVYTEAKLDDDN